MAYLFLKYWLTHDRNATPVEVHWNKEYHKPLLKACIVQKADVQPEQITLKSQDAASIIHPNITDMLMHNHSTIKDMLQDKASKHYWYVEW